MDANTPVTRSNSAGSPIQDNVREPAAREPAGKEPVKGPARPKGPNASAIVIGVVAMVFAGLVIAKETMGWRIDWSRLGPGGIVGIGVVMVVIGAIGLVRRHDDA
jgi:hypothetical protein